MKKEDIFTYIQNYLKNPPLVVWGSGATIDFGLPSMSDLNDYITLNVPFVAVSNVPLQTWLF